MATSLRISKDIAFLSCLLFAVLLLLGYTTPDWTVIGDECHGLWLYCTDIHHKRQCRKLTADETSAVLQVIRVLLTPALLCEVVSVILLSAWAKQQPIGKQHYISLLGKLGVAISLLGVLHEGLSRNFAVVEVTVKECPDLRQEPFFLAERGLSGSPRLVETGGVPYLLPLVNRDKKYDFGDVARLAGVPGGFVLGAGAGPAHLLGVNSELIANLSTAGGGANHTHCCKVKQDGGYSLEKVTNKEFCVLMNIFLSEGKPGQVLEVVAKQRRGPDNYMSCIRKTLAEHYGNKPVGLGGAFLISSGKAKIHIMPDFSEVPLTTDQQVEDWLKFFEMSAPLVCVGHLISHDPNLDLRMEHFHAFSNHGDGGHYHYDTTPDDVAYVGYFNVGDYMYRIDRPKETHQVGRD